MPAKVTCSLYRWSTDSWPNNPTFRKVGSSLSFRTKVPMKPIWLTLFNSKDEKLPQLVVYLDVVGCSGLLSRWGMMTCRVYWQDYWCGSTNLAVHYCEHCRFLWCNLDQLLHHEFNVLKWKHTSAVHVGICVTVFWLWFLQPCSLVGQFLSFVSWLIWPQGRAQLWRSEHKIILHKGNYSEDDLTL